MGGVDVHDQLRMQRYSVQLCYKRRKYYKTLFLGLLDMALVNAFIVYRYNKKVNNKRPPKHSAFLEELMEQLLAVDSDKVFTEIEQATSARDRTAASPARSEARQQMSGPEGAVDDGHQLEENPDTFDGVQGVKRRQRSCKVCALFKVKPRKFTKYFCPECSAGNKRKYMCNVVREGRAKTCFQIWHADWNNGNDIPRHILQDHKVRDRPPPSHPGKKRRRVSQAHGGVASQAEAVSEAEEEAGGSENADSTEEGMADDEL
ncbi:hypothetical protein PR002_g31363 [Phytophthora rubi]|uniref:PiggyBac transposable element-derived protein domain-containing protein n=1 Tax=Phytophthora rubi TaxID=129364 RepID=A0A6A3GR89_9STRA|nr:hypothetical protein PR002_g31363 [Phytophthora rubi]